MLENWSRQQMARTGNHGFHFQVSDNVYFSYFVDVIILVLYVVKYIVTQNKTMVS